MVREEFPASAQPELSEELAEWAGLPHLQVGALARLAQRAKGADDWDTYRRVMSLVDTLWRNPDHYLLNALNVSFLEHIDFDGARGPTAWEFLSPELQFGWRAMRAYNEKLARLGNPTLNRGKR